MSSSFLRRVTRYSVASWVNPRENRLTEITAAVLERVDGLAPLFVGHLLDAGEADAARRALPEDECTRRRELRRIFGRLSPTRVEVNTQVATNRGRFVDLEVLLRPAVGGSELGLLIWIEVKHGAGLHGDQLDAYVQDIAMRHVPESVDRVIVLVAPRGWEPAGGGLPAEVLAAHWNGIGRAISGTAFDVPSPDQRWLLSEYIRYLKEDGLSDPDALTATSALALMEDDAAKRAVAGICEHADHVVEADWGGRKNHRKTRGNTPAPAFGAGYWVNRASHREEEAPAATWRGAWFEWGLRDTASMEGLDNARGSWAFMAGATLVTSDNPTKIEGNNDWFSRRIGAEFHYFWIAGYYRLARVRYPDELLAETTLETQGRELGRWVVAAFAALADEPPPA